MKEKDRLTVLLVSVDESYDSPTVAREEMKKLYKAENMNLPYTVIPKGFESLQSMWGIDGYSLVLIKPDGTVGGVDLTLADLPGLMQ